MEKIENKGNKPLSNAVQFCSECKKLEPDMFGYNVYCPRCSEKMLKRLNSFN